MTQLAINHIENFAASLPPASNVNVEAMGLLVLIEQRDGSHILKTTRAHKGHGESITDAVNDAVAILRDYGHDATTPRQRSQRILDAAAAKALECIA
jgi:hypothetical protein